MTIENERTATPQRYTKRRDVSLYCEWCGEPIEVGESYDRWDCYNQKRATIYAHSECADEWFRQMNCGEMDQDAMPGGNCERPETACGGPQEACMRPNCPECGYKPAETRPSEVRSNALLAAAMKIVEEVT